MNLREIIALYRQETMDKASPPFASDEIVTLYANQAETEACRRGKLLRRSSSIEYAAGQRTISLDSKVAAVLRARGLRTSIDVVEVDFMDMHSPNWQRDNAVSDVQVLVSGIDTDMLHMWPIPKEAGAIDFVFQSLPVTPMVAPSDCPKIREEAHPALVDWILYKVYTMQDGELFNAQKGAEALKNFEQEFGKKASIRNETWVRDGQGMLPMPIA